MRDGEGVRVHRREGDGGDGGFEVGDRVGFEGGPVSRIGRLRFGEWFGS